MLNRTELGRVNELLAELKELWRAERLAVAQDEDGDRAVRRNIDPLNAALFELVPPATEPLT